MCIEIGERAEHGVALGHGDINQFVHHTILTYQHTPHSELKGMTPHEKWAESVQHIGVALPPLQEPGIERLFWRFNSDDRALTQNGISAFGMHYKAEELEKALRIDKQGRRVKYNFSYDSDNINRIAILHNGLWLCDARASELLLPDGSYRDLSLWEREMGQDLARKAGRPSKDWIEFLEEFSERQKRRAEEKHRAKDLKVNVSINQSSINAVDVQAALDQTAEADRHDYTQALASFSRGKR
jgi:hypothetical protein